MPKIKTTSIMVMIATVGLVTLAPSANAGGLFGKHGLIKGSVGNWVHDHVQAPILTPILKGTVVGAATAVGGVYGGALGAAGGAAAGNYINQGAAGHW